MSKIVKTHPIEAGVLADTIPGVIDGKRSVGPWWVSRLFETAPGGCVILGMRLVGWRSLRVQPSPRRLGRESTAQRWSAGE